MRRGIACQIEHAGFGWYDVGLDHIKARRDEQMQRCMHRGQHREHDMAIAAITRMLQRSLEQAPAESRLAMLGCHKQTADLCGVWRKFAQRHAASGLPIGLGQPQTAARRNIVTWKLHELLLNIVKSRTHASR